MPYIWADSSVHSMLQVACIAYNDNSETPCTYNEKVFEYIPMIFKKNTLHCS